MSGVAVRKFICIVFLTRGDMNETAYTLRNLWGAMDAIPDNPDSPNDTQTIVTLFRGFKTDFALSGGEDEVTMGPQSGKRVREFFVFPLTLRIMDVPGTPRNSIIRMRNTNGLIV